MASGVFRRKSSLCTTPCSGEVGKHFISINIFQHYINIPLKCAIFTLATAAHVSCAGDQTLARC